MTTILITAFSEFLLAGIALGMLYAFIDYITNAGNRNTVLAALITFLFFLAYTSCDPIFHIPFWLFAVTIQSTLALAAYYLLLRFHRGLLPLLLLALIVTNHLQQAAFNAFNDSISLHLLAAGYCCILAFFWSYAFTLKADTP